MYQYSNYIVRHLIHSTLLITFSLTSIVWLTQALRFIDFIVNQGVSILIFLQLTVLLVPSLIIMILPASLFCAVLFVYHKLKLDSELVVMQAAGLSPWRLARPALQVAALVMLIAYFIAFYLQPVSYREFRDMQAFLRNNYASIFLQDGVFTNPVDGLMIFVRERDQDNILHGILVHDNREPGQSVTMMAEKGELVQTPEGPRFILENGNRQEVREGRLSFLNFDRYALDMSLYAKSLSERNTDPQELFINQLFTYDDSMSPADNLKRFAEGHQRLLWPGYALSLTLIALAILLSGEFNRRGSWQRITFAVLIATALLFAAVGLRGMMAMKEAFVPVAYLNLLLPIAVACWGISDHVRYQAKAKPA